MEEHVICLLKVLSMLQQHQLFAKKSKCKFGCGGMKYLGHWCPRMGLGPIPLSCNNDLLVLFEDN